MRFTRLIILLLLLCIPVAVYGDSYCIDCGGDGRMPGDTQVCNPGSSPSDGQVLEWSDSSQCWDAATDNTGSGGSAITFDIGDDGGDDSTDLTEIATTGDTNSIFTEPSADKMLIDLSNNWPTADNAATADALSSNPTDCSANQFATTIAANGNLTCAAISDAAVPNDITIDLAATASALAANPTACSAGQFVTDLDADGTLTCDTPAGGGDLTGGDLDDGEFCIYNLSGGVVDCNVPLASLANLNTLLSTTIQDAGTLTDGRICTYDLTGTEIDCDTTNAPTATALAADPANCTSGQAAGGINASGTAESCVDPILESELGSLSALNTQISASLVDTGTLTDTNLCVYDLAGTEIDCNVTNAPTASALASNPTDCSANQFANTIAANGNLSCSAIGDADVPNDITIDLATAASALAANPDDCSANEWATAIAANGNLTCSTISITDLSDVTAISGNTSTVATTSGTLTSGDCVEFDASGNLVAAGAACGAGGSGDIEAVGSCTSGSCAIEGGNDMFPFVYEGTANTEETTFSVTDPTSSDKTITFPNLTGTVALSANKLDFFAATTSAELKGVISDETGSGGALVFATSPTLTTPTLGVASATSINKVAITAPATGSTLTIADGKTLTVSNTMSFASAGDSGVFTLPNATATLVGRDTTDTLTNKTISGSSNTLSNIPWASLTGVPAFRKTLYQLRPQAYEPPASNFATLFSRNGHPGLSFDGNVCAIWSFVMPNTYGGNGVTVDIYTVSSGTANDLDWDGSWERIETTQDIDSDSFATAVSADNNNNNATSGIPTKVSIAFTDGAQMDSCASGELCRFRLCRDDTSDTTAATNGLAVFIGGQVRETP